MAEPVLVEVLESSTQNADIFNQYLGGCFDHVISFLEYFLGRSLTREAQITTELCASLLGNLKWNIDLVFFFISELPKDPILDSIPSKKFGVLFKCQILPWHVVNHRDNSKDKILD